MIDQAPSEPRCAALKNANVEVIISGETDAAEVHLAKRRRGKRVA